MEYETVTIGDKVEEFITKIDDEAIENNDDLSVNNDKTEDLSELVTIINNGDNNE